MDFTDPGADWTAFEPERDLPALRARLTEMEAAQGVTEIHHRVSERILAHPSARRIPPVRHTGDVHGAVLSPCGRHFAVGSGIEVPEGAWRTEYEDGGVLRVYELASGLRVAGITEPGALPGGIGWSDFPGAVQWSADSARIALAYDTNAIGVWEAFAGTSRPLATAGVTDGGNRPPPYALAPDGRCAFVGMGPWDEFGVPGCLVPLENGDLDWRYGRPPPADGGENGPRHMSPVIGPPFEETPGELQLGTERVLGWDREATRIHVLDFQDVYAIDRAGGRLLWIHAHGMDHSWWDDPAPAAVDPDGTRVAWYTAERLRVADAATGEIRADLDREDAAVLVWGRDRLAALSPNGIRVIDGGVETDRLPTVAPIGKGIASEVVPAAWSRDGKRLVVITEDAAVEVWNLDGARERAASFTVPGDAEGVYWGDALVVSTRDRLLFRTPEGAVVNDIALHDEPAGWSVGGRHAWPAHWVDG